jgi:hypothetical protein
METRTDRSSRETRSGAGGNAGVLLIALACPLLCLGPLLLAGLASTGLAHVLRGAPWPLVAVAVLIVMALGIWGVRARGARGARDCCTPVSARPPREGTTR